MRFFGQFAYKKIAQLWIMTVYFLRKLTIPESEAVHFFAIVAEWSVAVRIPFQVQFDEFFQVGADDLIRIHENDFIDGKREQDVQEQYFVAPHCSLLQKTGINQMSSNQEFLTFSFCELSHLGHLY